MCSEQFSKKNMMLNNKISFWGDTLIYGIGFLFLRAISFLLLPLYTNLLSTNDVGLVFLLYTFLAFMNTIYSHGMDSALLKFFNTAPTNKVITTSFCYSFLLGLFFSAGLYFLYFIGENQVLNVTPIMSYQIVWCLIVILFSDMLSSRLITLVRLFNMPYYYLFVCLMNVILSVGLNYYFIHSLGLGLSGVIYALVCVSAVQIMILSPMLFRSLNPSSFDYILLQKMIKFSWPFLPASIFFILIEMADRWMLGYLSNVATVGLYGAGYKIGSIILLIVKSFNLNWQPYYLSANQDSNKINSFQSIGTQLLLMLIYCCTILSLVWPLLFNLHVGQFYFIGQNFWEGGKIIPIIGLSYVFYGLFILQMPSIYLKNKERWVPLFWGLGLIINISGNVLLIPQYTIYGAAISTLLAYSCMSVFLIYKNHLWLPIYYKIRPIACLLCVSIATYVLAIYQSQTPPILLILLIVYIIMGLYYIKSKVNLFTRL